MKYTPYQHCLLVMLIVLLGQPKNEVGETEPEDDNYQQCNLVNVPLPVCSVALETQELFSSDRAVECVIDTGDMKVTGKQQA